MILPFQCTLGSVDPVHGGGHWSSLGSEKGGVRRASREPGSVQDGILLELGGIGRRGLDWVVSWDDLK